MSRIFSLDIAKAICIILVVIGHYIPDHSPKWYVALDANLWYIFLPEAIVVILAGIIVPILLYKYILKRYRITKLAFGLKN